MNKPGFWAVALITFALGWLAIIKFFIPAVQAPTKQELINSLAPTDIVTSTESVVATPLEPVTPIAPTELATPIESVDMVTPTVPKATETPVAVDCQEAGGNWSGGYHECENIDAQWCQKRGGQFKECESACRHNQAAGFCTTQCIPVCQL
ncbi:MAG TPA: hypothetical protein PLT32_03425 [bacterium]|nr:hypothetical protein [bacterium]